MAGADPAENKIICDVGRDRRGVFMLERIDLHDGLRRAGADRRSARGRPYTGYVFQAEPRMRACPARPVRRFKRRKRIFCSARRRGMDHDRGVRLCARMRDARNVRISKGMAGLPRKAGAAAEGMTGKRRACAVFFCIQNRRAPAEAASRAETGPVRSGKGSAYSRKKRGGQSLLSLSGIMPSTASRAAESSSSATKISSP